MTNVAPALKSADDLSKAEYAGVVSRTTQSLLASIQEAVAELLDGLGSKSVIHAHLLEIDGALRAALELNERLTSCFSLDSLQTHVRVDGGLAPEGVVAVHREAADGALVLVVESDAGLRSLLTEVLRRQGHRVLEAASPDDAERLLEECPAQIDVLLTEILIEGTSGVGLAARLRTRQPEMNIIYTVGDEQRAMVPAGALGSGLLLRKPLTVASITDAVERARCL